MTDPYLLQRLEAEAALMRHHVEHGVAPPRPACRNGQPSRVCRNGHLITAWEDIPQDGCLLCRRLKHARIRAAA